MMVARYLGSLFVPSGIGTMALIYFVRSLGRVL